MQDLRHQPYPPYPMPYPYLESAPSRLRPIKKVGLALRIPDSRTRSASNLPLQACAYFSARQWMDTCVGSSL